MRFVGNERGMALIMAIGIMTVLGTAGATSMYYATAGARTSNYSNTKSWHVLARRVRHRQHHVRAQQPDHQRS